MHQFYFKLNQLPLSCSHCSCICKQTKTINVAFKIKITKPIQHLILDFAGLKIYGDGEWKVKKSMALMETGEFRASYLEWHI
ncbi:Mobile element protein [Candidatus Enterovibrio altilux]|uniref:Mobile element protein n=1 Tax=Candidatus Enterovibrio altilux TaxID=1927128 RepID=A0A291B9P1_9GAMM|nr:Mobile element protein [Candidatus Enterovibrio luxaltus]